MAYIDRFKVHVPLSCFLSLLLETGILSPLQSVCPSDSLVDHALSLEGMSISFFLSFSLLQLISLCPKRLSRKRVSLCLETNKYLSFSFIHAYLLHFLCTCVLCSSVMGAVGVSDWSKFGESSLPMLKDRGTQLWEW